uniref:Uncharacterized protein n=1 Tax=Anguilla anguilla TaxID=7936 RepID=A0A0E9XXQ7_ANGAN
MCILLVFTVAFIHFPKISNVQMSVGKCS